MSGILLDVRNIGKNFDAIAALSEVSVQVEAGERIGIIGPNGAGKTTFFNCVLGVLTPDTGTVYLASEDISQFPVHERARRGIGRTFQRIELFSGSTVRDHLLIAERIRRGTGNLWRDLTGRGKPRIEEIEACDHVLDLLGLGELANRPIEQLSLGQGRLVEVGRALMTQPKVLLLDEPSSGLDHQETADLAETLLEVQASSNFSIILVEHDVELVASFTDRCYVLDFGRLIASGATQEVLTNPVVREAYLGENIS
ncbi:MAG: ABC transporter ATP-binding protein [Actinobacteria bacterium]|jgi:branched-chain amino acid transport system ATP-binding protein|nr:ABC transporter ATP-binding protein [Actinomycetota bacterium]